MAVLANVRFPALFTAAPSRLIVRLKLVPARQPTAAQAKTIVVTSPTATTASEPTKVAL